MSGQRRPALRVEYMPIALQELEAIWDWNAARYGREHAWRYHGFLQEQIDALGQSHLRGRNVGASAGPAVCTNSQERSRILSHCRVSSW